MAYYESLGSLPAAMNKAQRRDPLLRRTGAAARQLLRRVERLPRNRRLPALVAALRSFDAELPRKVQAVAERLQKKGLRADKAVEKALMLSLADASITKIKRIGEAHQKGMLRPVGSLGRLGETSDASGEQKPEDVVASMFQGIVCSEGLQSSIAELVGRNEGRDAHDATNIGYDVAQGFAQCHQLQQQPTPPAPPPAPQEQDDSSSLLVPILVGVGALAAVGGVVYFTRKQ
jgi:hypothetical protein